MKGRGDLYYMSAPYLDASSLLKRAEVEAAEKGLLKYIDSFQI